MTTVLHTRQLLAETKEGIAVLRTFNIVNFAGAALPVGDILMGIFRVCDVKTFGMILGRPW